MPVFQPNRAAYSEDPYPFLHRLRSEEPVHRSRELGAWVITSYVEALRALTDDDHFSSDPTHASGELGAMVRRQREEMPLGHAPILGNSDAPEHTRLRAIVNRAFTPRALAVFDPDVAAIVDDLLGQWRTGEAFEVMSGLAQPLAITTVLAYLGVPREGLAAVREWSSAIMAARSGQASSPGDVRAAVHARTELEGYLRSACTGGVIRELLTAEAAGQLSADEWIILLIHISFAGNGPTAYAIGNALLALATHPDQFAELKDGRTVAAAVEECLRFDTPTHVVHRFVTADVELRGRKLRVGDTVAVVVGAANRDPARFPNSDVFDLGRDAGGQLAFGHGMHFCLGAPLARIELAAVLDAVRSRFDALTLAPAGLWRGDTFLLRGPSALTLEAR